MPFIGLFLFVVCSISNPPCYFNKALQFIPCCGFRWLLGVLVRYLAGRRLQPATLLGGAVRCLHPPLQRMWPRRHRLCPPPPAAPNPPSPSLPTSPSSSKSSASKIESGTTASREINPLTTSFWMPRVRCCQFPPRTAASSTPPSL